MQKNVKSIASSIANRQDYYATYFLREKLGVPGHLNLFPQTYEKNIILQPMYLSTET
jgi:hypothetical protein